MSMLTAKYVIVDGRAIVFSSAIEHRDMIRSGQVCTSAGFVRFDHTTDDYGDIIIIAKCYGSSFSLGIKSKPKEDSELLTRQITNP